jgi:5-formyltetrahydrofolate cyclo-ligase
MIFQQKQTLRQSMRLRLREMDPWDRAVASASISARLEEFLKVLQPRRALAFVPLESEPDWWLRPAIDRMQFAYPRMGRYGASFFRIQSPAHLVPGRSGILEPPEIALMCVDVAAADLVLVPGLAFDAEGRRLGRGSGHYDAILKKTPSGCRRIGVAFDLQMVDHVPVEEHDQRVDAVLTPGGFTLSPPRR